MRTAALCLLVVALAAGCESGNKLLYYGAEGLPRKSPDPRDLVTPNTEPTPDMAAGRSITEVDCSKPVDLSRGNLRCK
jgi:hypothetical protein